MTTLARIAKNSMVLLGAKIFDAAANLSATLDLELVLDPTTADPFTRRAVRVSMGAFTLRERASASLGLASIEISLSPWVMWIKA